MNAPRPPQCQFRKAIAILSAATLGLYASAAFSAETDANLAAEIRADPTLTQVHQMAQNLLRRGLNAGSGYSEVWIRDLNTFIEVALEVNPPERLRDALLTFFKFQGPAGDIVDGYVPLDQAKVQYAYRTSALATNLMAHKNTVETDQESSLVQAVRKYVRATRDTAFLDEQVNGTAVRERLGLALGYVMTERFDRKHGLVWGATTADWGDVQPESPWGVELDAQSHRALDIYDNAMLILALNDYLDLLGENSSQTPKWRQTRDELKRNVRAHLWDANRQKFIPHVYLDGSPFPGDFEESAIYYHGGTAVAIQAGLLSPEEVSKSLDQMVANVKAAEAASIGLTLYPPYPEGFFKNPQMRSPYSYQNGGDWCWFGGRMIQALIQYGYISQAYRELRPMVERVKRTGGFYEWWSRDNQPRGSGEFRGSAGVLGRAIELLQAWANRRDAAGGSTQIQEGEMSGYLLVPNKKVPETYNAGFSLYVAAWPLLQQYPGHEFQSGLPGTWMFAQYDGQAPTNLYSDIEGGLGWWRDTRFATETPKFIMGGVAPNFIEWANGPGAGKNRDWDKPEGLYGVAQLSPWLLWPPDGLNLKQGTCGELFGYGYLPLPLIPAKTNTAGTNVPTGDHSWTLFLNTRNFKGPVAFFTPYFWSRASLAEPRLVGKLLDTRPSNPNRALQMETQYIPSVQATDSKGEMYARIARTFFPGGLQDEAVMVHQITSYNKSALWDGVKTWFEGGTPASGALAPQGACVHNFSGGGGATWRIYTPDVPDKKRVPLAWNSFATPTAITSNTFGYRWNNQWVKRSDSPDTGRVTLPEYYHLVTNKNQKAEWVPVQAEDVPADTGLVQFRFKRPTEDAAKPYVTPDDPSSCWKRPGPVAGPFQSKVGDGSVVTYYWYRFADQPALQNADLTAQEREHLQARVVKVHRNWGKDRDYLAPPTTGQLAEIDPALIVTPPPGLEAGYVPIVTRQAAKE
jgi:hypothetical protein